MENDRTLEGELDAMAEATARFAADLYLFVADRVVQELGQAGEEAIRNGLREFGLARGRAIRAAVEAAGQELNLENFQKYYDLPFVRAWRSEGRDAPESRESVINYCPFAEQWKKRSGARIGQMYCEEVDPALREGYSSTLRFTASQFLLRDGGPCLQKDEVVQARSR